jgi:hypothetical protein
MSYKTETTNVSAQYLNAAFVRKITDEGKIKEAAVEGTAFIREKVRQESFAREIIVPVGLQDDEIDRDVNHDQPKKIVEKEPASIATYVPFTGSGPRVWFRGPRYEIRFAKVESQRFTKSKFELMTYQNDIRKILSDNSVKDMADVEDTQFLNTIKAIIALNPAQVTPAPAFNSVAWTKAEQAMAARRRPIGKFLMTKELFYEAQNLPASAVGYQVAGDHYHDGIEKEERLWGMPVVTTVKSDIFQSVLGSSRTAFVFSPENFLGNFFLLQDATLFIKQEADIITFYSYESIGLGIGNRLSVQQINF